MNDGPINIVWFKRDLRLADHEPLAAAIAQGIPTLLVYSFEPAVISYPDSDHRHWRFVHQSLTDMQLQLSKHACKLHIFHTEVVPLFTAIFTNFKVINLFSYAETGNQLTFHRDKAVADLCRSYSVRWQEFQCNGVIRGLQERSRWQQLWKQVMAAPIVQVSLAKLIPFHLPQYFSNLWLGSPLHPQWLTTPAVFQPGGESAAWRYLNDFFAVRYPNYNRHISRPHESRKSCSRLSPYLAWGNLSIRQVYQAVLAAYPSAHAKQALAGFLSRLHWHCHFIQKFENECSMEFQDVNKGYLLLHKPIIPNRVDAWATGNTGVPLVDAAMRCVIQTGYLNFRIRAMLVSFLVFNLWQPWQQGAYHLARMFLDYEPGIHFPQFQMQAGVTGVNTIRIYNPVRNGLRFDTQGVFVKQWLPQLAGIPPSLIHEPWKMSHMEQQMYGCVLGTHYPHPIVNVEQSGREASAIIYQWRHHPAVIADAQRILQRHTNRKTTKDRALSLKLFSDTDNEEE